MDDPGQSMLSRSMRRAWLTSRMPLSDPPIHNGIGNSDRCLPTCDRLGGNVPVISQKKMRNVLLKFFEVMMGADAPIPPVVINGRRPEGRPAAASISFFKNSSFLEYPFKVIQKHRLRPRPLGGVEGLQTRDTRRTCRVLRVRAIRRTLMRSPPPPGSDEPVRDARGENDTGGK